MLETEFCLTLAVTTMYVMKSLCLRTLYRQKSTFLNFGP